jgi:hypothetical protein
MEMTLAEVRPFGRQDTTVRTRLKTGNNFSAIFGKPIAQLSVRMAYDYCLDGAYVLSSQMLIRTLSL